MLYRNCTKCLSYLPYSEFSARKRNKSGITSQCKSCLKDTKHKWASNNRAKVKNSSKKYATDNRELKVARTALWRECNQQHVLDYAKAYIKRNLEKCLISNSRRNAAKLQAVPKLSDIDQEFNDLFILEAYSLSRLRTNLTGIKHHVDHIVPLRSDFVCGLHYYHNLRVITAKENQMKSNIYWEHM